MQALVLPSIASRFPLGVANATRKGVTKCSLMDSSVWNQAKRQRRPATTGCTLSLLRIPATLVLLRRGGRGPSVVATETRSTASASVRVTRMFEMVGGGRRRSSCAAARRRVRLTDKLGSFFIGRIEICAGLFQVASREKNPENVFYATPPAGSSPRVLSRSCELD